LNFLSLNFAPGYKLVDLSKTFTILYNLSKLSLNADSTLQHLGERNKYVESEIALWIEAVLNDPIPPKDFDDLLRDGVLLCRVMNALKPGSVSKIQKPWTKDNQRANIQAFIDAARSYGVPDEHLFSVEDLHEKTGIPNVTKTMIFLGKAIYDHSEWQGPYLGPRPTGQIKDWPEEKLRAGEGIVPLQAGTNKFATQKGLRIGRARDIM